MSGPDQSSGSDDPHARDSDRAALSRRLQEADPGAHAEAFRRFYAPLVRYACRFTGNREAAADVVQDVFLKLWEQRQRLEIRSSLKAMLYTMVRNHALNTIRRQKKVASNLGIEEVRQRQDEHAPTPSEAAEAAELRRYIHRWIDELPERRAEAFVLSRYHGLSHQEIASIMDVSKRTVDTHIYHALCDLRKRLDVLQDDAE